MGKTGPKLGLNNKKLKALFPAMMIAPQNKYIANALGVIKTDTIKDWYLNGMALMEKFENELEPLDDIFSFEYEATFDTRKEEFEDNFKLLYDIGLDEKVPDRLRLEYNNYMLNEKRKFIESNIERRENDILNNIILSNNKELDDEFKLYIKFARIYNRAKCVKEVGYIQNIDKHAGTSKNVGLSLKMLEKMNKEDFGDTQTVKHEGNIQINTKSILALSMQLEKEEKQKQQLLAQKNENIIDIKPINLLEASEKNKESKE